MKVKSSLGTLTINTLLFPLSNQVREEDKGKYVHHIPLLFFIKKEEIGNEVAQPL